MIRQNQKLFVQKQQESLKKRVGHTQDSIASTIVLEEDEEEVKPACIPMV